MCGINGFVFNNVTKGLAQKNLETMNQKILHRGPDQDGFFIEETPENIVAFAMRRLSIIDLSSGKQPISSSDGNKTIVFNGEIYNYKSLKDDLIQQGYTFSTQSDTEVVVNLYDKYGVKAFSMLDGMFALSIYDKILNKVIIARDYFGEKPLYYHQNKNGIIWASELKSIFSVLDKTSKPAISKTGLSLFFQLTYIPAPFTIYEEVAKLEANHYLEYDCTNNRAVIKKIDESTHDNYEKLSKLDAIKINHDLVQKSVESRSISDVPLGTFLSGGVDSSIVSLCLAQQSEKKIDTFSIGFDKKQFDETEKSKIVSKIVRSNHHEFILSEKDLFDEVHSVLLNFDEPFADSSALPTYLVANKTSKHVTVALTGDGGDEAYGGYNKYYMGTLNRKYTAIVPKALHKSILAISSKVLFTKDDQRGLLFKANKFLKAINYQGEFYYNIVSLGFLQDEMNKLLSPKYYTENALGYYKNIIKNKNLTLTDFRNIDQILSLEGDMLVKVDRATMLSSLEARSPFLNKEIWNFTSQLPEQYLMNKWDKKHILKESFRHYFPEGFLDKSKKGFGVPVGDWLRNSLKPELKYYLDKKRIEEQGIFNFDEISKIAHAHLEGRKDNTFRVWTFYCFQKWYFTTYFINKT